MTRRWCEPVKRTTIVVRDFEASEAFYRELLELQTFYAGFIENPTASAFVGVPCDRIRMLVLSAGAEPYGRIGLLHVEGAQGLRALRRARRAGAAAADGTGRTGPQRRPRTDGARSRWRGPESLPGESRRRGASVGFHRPANLPPTGG